MHGCGSCSRRRETGGPPPLFPSWEPDAASTQERYDGLSGSEAAEVLRASRRDLVRELSTLSESQWLATARHAAWGPIDLPALLDHALGHDDEHMPR